MAKKFYIKERYNPQFKKPYYTPMGQLFKKEANKKEAGCIYGVNYMLPYNTEEEYNKALEEFKQKENLTDLEERMDSMSKSRYSNKNMSRSKQ